MSELELEAKMQKILEDYGALLKDVTPESKKIEEKKDQSKTSEADGKSLE